MFEGFHFMSFLFGGLVGSWFTIKYAINIYRRYHPKEWEDYHGDKFGN